MITKTHQSKKSKQNRKLNIHHISMPCLYLLTWVKNSEMNRQYKKMNPFFNLKSQIIHKKNLSIIKKLRPSLIIFGWIKTLKMGPNQIILINRINKSIKLKIMSNRWSNKLIISRNQTFVITLIATKIWKTNKFKILYSVKIWKKLT